MMASHRRDIISGVAETTQVSSMCVLRLVSIILAEIPAHHFHVKATIFFLVPPYIPYSDY